jgi:hypothetical protein
VSGVIPKVYIEETMQPHACGTARTSARTILWAMAVAFLAMAPAACQLADDSHTVTVVVPERHGILVTGGDITLTITPKLDGSDPDPVIDNGCDLIWFSNRNNNKRITVQSDIVAPAYTLTVEASNISGTGAPGTAEPVVTLVGGTAWDLITGVRRCLAQCDLIYTASATAADPPGTEVHTVTYTLTNR